LNVSAAVSDIDWLNTIRGTLNPLRLGYWIELSEKGGMDGGWIFGSWRTEEFNFLKAIGLTEPISCNDILKAWVQRYNILKCISITRDIGTDPPRQTGFMFKVPGETYEAQIICCIDGINTFSGEGNLPDNVVKVLEKYKPIGMHFFVTITSEGFCKFGILVPINTYELRNAFIACNTQVNTNKIDPKEFFDKFSKETKTQAKYARLHWIIPHFGYGLYVEGFQIAFDFDFGLEM